MMVHMDRTTRDIVSMPRGGPDASWLDRRLAETETLNPAVREAGLQRPAKLLRPAALSPAR